MPFFPLTFSDRANEQLFARNFQRRDVVHALRTGEVLRQYPTDEPYPSYLILAWTEEENARPIHVVAADDREAETTIIITVYEPDPAIWTDDFRRKRDDE